MYDYKALYKFLEKKNPIETQNSEKENKVIKLYLLNDEETKLYIPSNSNSIFSNQKNEYRIAINESFYNYKSINRYFDKELNLLSINYVTKITKYRNKYLFPILIVIVLIFMIVTTTLISLPQTKDYAVYSLFAMFIVVISTLILTNKLLLKKTQNLNVEVNKKVMEHLGLDLYNEVRDNIEEFNKIKNNILPIEKEKDVYEENLLENNKDEINQVEEKKENN